MQASMITTDEDKSYEISDFRKTTEKSKVQYLVYFFTSPLSGGVNLYWR